MVFASLYGHASGTLWGGMRMPQTPALYGFAGLLPQIIAVAALQFGGEDIRWYALSAAYLYAATILSFLGGIWWGMAASRADAPKWIYGISVLPQLIAFASGIPWATGGEWPGPSMAVLGIALIACLAVDHKLAALGIAPAWWMRLRVPLSLGLGILTLMVAGAPV